VPQALQLPGVDAVPGLLEPLLEQARERQIHVVAAEQDVLADRDALERQLAVCSATAMRLKSVVPPPMSHTSTRSPTRDTAPPAVAERVEPRVERGLRLLEQRDAVEPGGVRRAQRQLARLLVERRRHGQQHILRGERQPRIRVPRREASNTATRCRR
jgi:hypothetical protein